MKTRLVRIGDSQGVRMPRSLLETAGGLGEDAVLRVTPGRIVIEAARASHAGAAGPGGARVVHWRQLCKILGRR